MEDQGGQFRQLGHNKGAMPLCWTQDNQDPQDSLSVMEEANREPPLRYITPGHAHHSSQGASSSITRCSMEEANREPH